MSMLKTCSASGCATKTLGELCLAHESQFAESALVAVRRRTTIDTAGQLTRNQTPNASRVTHATSAKPINPSETPFVGARVT